MRMRSLLVMFLVGLVLSVFVTAALACGDEVYNPPQNNSPEVQQPQPGSNT